MARIVAYTSCILLRTMLVLLAWDGARHKTSQKSDSWANRGERQFIHLKETSDGTDEFSTKTKNVLVVEAINVTYNVKAQLTS